MSGLPSSGAANFTHPDCAVLRRRNSWLRKIASPRMCRPGCCFLLACMLLAARPSCGQLQDEYQVKAALVFNLTKYVDWPQQHKELTIAFVGEGPMGKALSKTLSGKLSGSRYIRVVLAPSEQALTQCDIAFVGEASTKKTRELIEKFGDRSILTVGDTASFAKNGGMVGLVTREDQVQIEVNLQALQTAHLTMSSRLLSLARIIGPGKGTGK